MAWKLYAIEQTPLLRQHRVDGLGAPAGAQPMGGLPIEEFLAVMNGGGDSGDLVGKLMQLGISLASNAG